MSIKTSGIWCDLCNKPILLNKYGHITLSNTHGITRGHACAGCFKKHANEKTVHTDEAREALK